MHRMGCTSGLVVTGVGRAPEWDRRRMVSDSPFETERDAFPEGSDLAVGDMAVL